MDGEAPANLSDFAAVIADVLVEVVQSTREYHITNGGPKPSPSAPFGLKDRLTPFDGSHIPSIPLDKYLQRLARYATTNPSCFLAALVYLDRIIVSHPEDFALSDLNVHRLFLASLVLATKFWSDKFYDNEYYGKIGGVPAHELSILEANLLAWLDFRLLIESESFGEEYLKMSNGCTKPLALPTLLCRFSECPCCCLGPQRALSPIGSILDAMMLEAPTLSRIPLGTGGFLSGMIRRAGSPNCICCRAGGAHQSGSGSSSFMSSSSSPSPPSSVPSPALPTRPSTTLPSQPQAAAVAQPN